MSTRPVVDLQRAAEPYPEELETDAILRDGSTVHIRPARPADDRGLDRFLSELSHHARWFRFFSDWTNYGEFIERAVDNDHRTRLDLVATSGPDIVAHAMYVTTEPQRAEVAFAVADAWQGLGLATIMLGRLAEAALTSGVTTFEAVTLPENEAMIAVLRDGGFPAKWRQDPGEARAEFPTAAVPPAVRRFEALGRHARSVTATDAAGSRPGYKDRKAATWRIV